MDGQLLSWSLRPIDAHLSDSGPHDWFIARTHPGEVDYFLDGVANGLSTGSRAERLENVAASFIGQPRRKDRPSQAPAESLFIGCTFLKAKDLRKHLPSRSELSP